MVEGGGMSYTMSKGARAELSARGNVRGEYVQGNVRIPLGKWNSTFKTVHRHMMPPPLHLSDIRCRCFLYLASEEQ